jgi:hypothetical protein
MKTEPTLHKRLKIGDRVRLVHLPTEFSQPGYHLHRDTLRVYKRLVALRKTLTVNEIDSYRLPWVQFRLRREDGGYEHHFLAINHDGLVLVRRRR